eukprot:TRINITY_DN10654_c0_g1_i1.p1 TRINITY_DN10654_c0_g1~~TRINITY_DN10654_c0_g1_i1.p1  ORF type:complete len:111 (-),score=1.01 TRINITY_DN10654_c0_g1_i1:199-531(-)
MPYPCIADHNMPILLHSSTRLSKVHVTHSIKTASSEKNGKSLRHHCASIISLATQAFARGCSNCSIRVQTTPPQLTVSGKSRTLASGCPVPLDRQNVKSSNNLHFSLDFA